MAHLNTALLVANATGVLSRANEVQQDPAVRKAWREASADIAQAARSVSAATVETKIAWHRSGFRSRGAGARSPW